MSVVRCTISAGEAQYVVDFSRPFDLCVPVTSSEDNVKAFYITHASIEPLSAGSFVGSVKKGGSVNCEQIRFCPHGNGTHTECVGHVLAEPVTVFDAVRDRPPLCLAAVVSIEPEPIGESGDSYPANHDPSDKVISARQLRRCLEPMLAVRSGGAVCIRTLPNPVNKRQKDYSGSNPPFLTPSATEYLRLLGIQDLLVDLPSIDRELDEGRLPAHCAFWNLDKASGRYLSSPGAAGCHSTRTVTELCYVPNEVADGLYALALQVAPIASDAAPSRPVLYPLSSVTG